LQASATFLLAAGTLALGSLAMLHTPTLVAFTTPVALAANPSTSPTLASLPVAFRETAQPTPPSSTPSSPLAGHPANQPRQPLLSNSLPPRRPLPPPSPRTPT
jgi:hypothetical protein